jgi:hypothetical protein
VRLRQRDVSGAGVRGKDRCGMRALARLWPLRNLSGAHRVVPPAQLAEDRPLDYALDEAPCDDDATTQRHKEPAR